MTLETWLSLNKSPLETRKKATERYIQEQGIFDPAEKQKVLDEVNDYVSVTPLEAQSDFTQDTYGDWTPPQSDYTPTDDEYNADPDFWDSLGRGFDQAQGAVFGFGEGPVSGFLDDIGLEDASAGLKEWSREGRLEQERQAAQVAPAKSVEQEVAENPDSFYKYFDKDMMTAGQMAESAPTSLTPWLAAVPLALATPYLASAAGIAATGTLGSKLIAAGVGMGAGNLASSAIVSSEAYDRGKSDPIIRQQLGVDPNKAFRDLSNSDQQKVDRVATDLSQTSFGHRLYTAGLVEMASYIPYGHALVRLALDTGLGTASEVWDRTLYSEDAVTALIENGVPAEKAEELREAIIQAGPSFRQTMIAALQQEFVMGGAATGIESIIGQTAPQVNAPGTASKKLREEVARIQELNLENARKQEQKQIDYDDKLSAEEERQKLRDRSAAFNQEQKSFFNERGDQLKANQKELLENVKHTNKLEEIAIKEQTPDLPPIDQEFRKAEAKKKATRDRRVDRVYKELEAKDAKKAEKEKQSRLKASLKRNEVIARKKKALENREKKLFGVKGEKGRFTSLWKREQFMEYDDIKQKRLELKQLEKEQKNDKGEPLLTEKQLERNKNIDANARRKKAEDIVDNTFHRSAIQSEGDYQLQKGLVQNYIDDLASRSDKYKGIYTVLNNNSAEELATILEETGYEGDALAQAEQLLLENNAWVYKDHIYVNEDNIRGANKEEAFTNLAKIVAFHEPIAHLGLKEFLQSDYEPFLDNFFETNKDFIQQWAENEAITDEGDAAYLEGADFNDLSESQQRDLAEEFLANKFVEMGILDPDIISRTADALVSALKGVLTPSKKRVSTTEARAVLAEIQRQYLGGKKNIITGDLFDPANWTMKGIEVAADEDKVQAYKRYLKEQGIVIERGGKEFIKKEFAPRPTEPKTAPKPFQNRKIAPYKIPVNASKRIVTPRQAEIWKTTIGKKRGKGRTPKSPILMAMATKLEKGTVSYEEYQKKADEILPIKKFESVPTAATDKEILSSIDSEQYREGLILGEDSLTKKDVVNVRLDIPAYTRYDSWVATITHGKDTIYGAAVRLKDVTFKAPLMGALRIAQGSEKKPLATMKGTWQENSIAEIEKMAGDYINDPAWVQIGYNPERQSSFYIREDKNGETKGTPLESAEEIIQVGGFILAKNPVTKDTPSYTTKEGVTFKFSKKLSPMQKKVYSLLKPTEKSIAYTKTAKNRPEERQKRPTAKLQKFTLPKRANGKSPIIYVGGGKTTENWKEQVESVLSNAQIKDAIQWYPRVKNAFVKEFGKDRAPNMMLAWALANKAESPLGAMKNVLRAKENLANTINPELRKKGGLNDDVITKILKDEEATKGSGVKLYDFVDAMLGMETRNWAGFDPEMGAPAVVDRHTWRDRGWIDNTVVNFIKDNLPEDKKAKSLKSDKPNPNVTPIEYEETASWLRDITNDLNNEKWMGRSNWTPDQTQAVGWMAVTELLEIPGGTSQSVLAETGRSVAFETFWGTDSPFRNKYEKSFNQLTKEQQIQFLYDISDKVADIAIERTGITEKDRIKGWGFWENTPMNPNMIINISATDQGIANLMDTIGLLAQQDSVVAFGPKHNAVEVGIDVYDKNGKFSDPELLDKVYRGLLKASPWDKGGVIQGASQTTVKGVPALRIILANTKAKGKKVAQKIANNKLLQKQKKLELKPHMVQLANDLDLDIMVESFQAQMFDTSNDWKGEHPNGELYRRRIDQNFRPTVSRRIQDRDATTIENEIKKQFDGFGIKYSKRTRTPTTSGTARKVYKGQLEVESDGQSHFVHWSNSPDLEETDPSYYGTGMKGAEQKFQKGFPDLWVDRTFFGLPGYRRESGVGINMYEIAVDPNTMYDLQKDPDGVWPMAIEEVGYLGDRYIPRAEGIIKELGYAGYFRKDHNAGVFYHPTKVKFIRQEGGSSIYTPSIRVKASKRMAKASPPRDKWLQYISGQQEGFEPVGRPDTPEWNEFMEGSKIKYPLYHGTPLVLEKRYSDTQAELEEKGYEGTYGDNIYSASFQFNKLEPGQFNYTGLHLSSEPEYANMYADKDISMDYSTLGKDKGPNVIKGFVNVKNPLKLEVTANVKNWKKGVSHLREKIKKSGQGKSGKWLVGSRGGENYAEFELLDEINKKENIKMRERLIKLLDPETFFGKEERKAMSSYTFNRLDLRLGKSQNKEFLEYVTMQLEQEMPYHEGSGNVQQEFLNAAMNTVIVHGMGHDALLYVQEVGDMAPRPFIGVMLLDPQYTQVESEKTKGFINYNTDENVMPLFPFRSAYNQKPNDPNDFKFSKRVKNYSPDDLISEWKTNIKADVSPPPAKKDKVTLSKEGKDMYLKSKITKADISPDAILNPDGNIKASRILASRAAHHAISTRDTGKKVPLRYKLAEKLTRRLRSQGTLPDSEAYKALRRIASGTIVKAEETGRALYEALKKTKQPETIYRYFTEKGFDPAKIKNVAERKAAVDAKAKIQQIGVDLVGMGLMDEGARLQYEGEYLPKQYLKYLIPDEAIIKVRGGGIRIDAKYLKKRRDIPEGIRKLILGEVKDPAYLATRATTVPIKDMAIINWLQQIAGNPNWVLPSTLVKFDLLGEMKNAALDINIQKELELKDTFGVNVSAHWLANEADRIYNRTKHMPHLTDTESKIIKKVTAKMQNMAKEVNDNMSVDSSQYSLVPKTAKYGMLGGMAVRKEIADDIFGGMSMTTGDISKAEAIFGDGGKVGDYNRLWKWAKVSANPPSWVRNFVSNMILMNMGGVAFYKMPGLIVSSLRDMRKTGSDKGALHQLTKDLGLTSGNFSNVELGRIEREFKDLQVRMKREKAGPMAVLGMMKGAFNKVQDWTSDTYGGIDSLGKMMMVKNAMNEAGLKVKDLKDYSPKEMAKLDDIALNAEKWLFDYSNPLPSVKWLRRAPFGAPFISFTSFVAPLMLETAITKPWKFLPYYALGFAAKEFFKETQDLDEEQYEGLKVSMSEYLREKAYTSVFPSGVVPWPFLDENGRVVFQDISYLFPWGMFSEMGGEVAEGKYFDAMKTAGLMGGPTLNVASAILTGIDPFTRQPIVDSTGTFAEQGADVMWYAFNLTMPPMFHGIGQGPNQGYGAIKRLTEAYTGQLTKDGEARFTKSQAWLRMFGQNVTPIAVPEGRNKQLRYEYSRLKKLERLAKRDLKNSIIMQESQEDIQEKLEAYKEKILKARKELMKKVQISAPPVTLLRQREEALKKMRQRLLKQKSA